MVYEKGNAARGSANLADYAEFMSKVTRSSFEDADLDNRLASSTSPCGKVETFDDLLEEL